MTEQNLLENSVTRSIYEDIENNKKFYIEFLQKLIQINTSKPAGNINQIVFEITDFLEEERVICEKIPVQVGKEQYTLFAFLNDSFEKKNLLFNGNMDAVPADQQDDWRFPPFSATIKRKQIYGRGAKDIKGGLPAMVITLRILKKICPNLKGNLIFNTVIDEEIDDKWGTKFCIEIRLNSINMDFAIVGEPTGLYPLPKSIVMGEKGVIQVKVHTKGKSCHFSMPFIGQNTIDMIWEINHHLEELETYLTEIPPPMTYDEIEQLLASSFPNQEIFQTLLTQQSIIKHLLLALTTSTYSFNIIKGGDADNIVPGECEGLIDFRLLAGQNPVNIMHALEKMISNLGFRHLDQTQLQSEAIGVYLEQQFSAEASYWNEWRNSTHLRYFYNLVEQTFGRKPFYFLYPACSDARFIRNTGCCRNTIVFGPGNAGSVHSVDESIEVEDFLNAIKIYALFAYKFLKK
ncbi:MAG: N-formyl-4-amino-5-aminomethyl-2-methylpyrimidine deformylase [Promethearchaeota archaeon]|nr:MAG: N-formyl-4-amino-5-aminomethyl-2-methylpyrimidine deformylase [Candidatus Lokiarchaeota archaeon]